MKKNILLLFAALLPLVASAEKVEIDGIWYNLITKGKLAEVTSSDGTKYSGSITLPATVTYNGVAYSVTSIGERAFFYCLSLTAITLPESVTSIGNYAFDGCSSLTTITIPEGVTSIGSSAFHGCSSLNAVHISSIEAWCKILFEDSGSNPLYYAHAHNLYLNGELVTELVIPESVTSIGKYAFRDCLSLTAITIPASVTSIGNSAFHGCSSLTTITIPENSQLTSIGDWTFSGCSSLTTITIPEGVTSIGGTAFNRCSSLTAVYISSIEAWCKILFEDSGSNPLYYAHNLYLNGELITELVIPESVTSIGVYAFEGCSSLTAITIPEGVTSIGSDAFYYCSSLTTITIPEGVTSIGSYAFEGCSSLTTILLPKSVSSIGYEAFVNCPELSDVYCYAETAPTTSANAFDGSYPEYATLHVPTSAMNSYKTTAPWSGFGTIIALGASITEITLSESSATLTEGNELTLTMTTTPDDADRKLISWSSSNPSVATVDNTGKVTAIAPGTATITATANDGSGVSAQCELTVNELILGKCATPTINYEDGKVILACETEGTKVITNVVAENAHTYEDLEFTLSATYTITAYATKEDYENSDEVTLTLCWIPCTEDHEEEDDESTGILTIPAKPVFISTQGGVITVSGLAEGTDVAVVTTNGISTTTATATDGTATLATNLTPGTIAIVKIGDYSIKVAIK